MYVHVYDYSSIYVIDWKPQRTFSHALYLQRDCIQAIDSVEEDTVYLHNYTICFQ